MSLSEEIVSQALVRSDQQAAAVEATVSAACGGADQRGPSAMKPYADAADAAGRQAAARIAADVASANRK